MASPESERRQRALGGAVGVTLLALALVYHFFPQLLHLQPSRMQPQGPSVGGSRAPLMGFEQRPASPAPESSELNAGPPLSLAPSAVIAARGAATSASASVASAAPAPAQTTPDSPEVVALLQRADKALDNGQLVGGDGSAAALFLKALKLRPDSRRAHTGLVDVRTQLVAEVDQDLGNSDVDAASASLDALRQLPGSDADVQRLQHSLTVVKQVAPLLAEAGQQMQQGHYTTPASGNALALYRQVLTMDPANSVALDGVARIQQRFLDSALSAVAQDDFKGADAALAQAAEVAPDSQSLQNVRERIESLRRQRAESVLAQARSALDGGNLDLAAQLGQQAAGISPDVQGLDAFEQKLHNARVYASYKPGEVFSDRFVDTGGTGPQMVVIPTGSFMMGSPDGERGHQADESPMHQVTIDRGFAMARTEITVAQFRDFVRATGYVTDSQRLGGSSVYDGSSGSMRNERDATWEDDYAGRPASDDMPVVNISWNDAHAYAQWLAKRTGKPYRLPSEAEFEYALRAGTTTRFWWGDGRPTRVVENVTGGRDRSPRGRRWSNSFSGYRDGYWGPAPVMSFQPNPFGLYDMDGNVSEWVEDCWHDNYTRAPKDGSAWVNPGCQDRVVRGGSWGSAPDQVRSAYRLGAEADIRSGRVGFRVVRVL